MMVDDIFTLPNVKQGATAIRNHEIDTLLIHYTATQELPRVFVNYDKFKRKVASAVKLGSLRPDTQKRIDEAIQNGRLSFPISDALALCVINAENVERKAAWHYCIASLPGDTNHDVINYVHPGLQCGHVGRVGGDTNCRSIGIELVNPGQYSGRMSRAEAAAKYHKIGWPDPTPQPIRGPDGARYWFSDPVPEDQLSKLYDLSVDLFEEYPTLQAICSHQQFSPNRRIDPDPPYSLKSLRSFVRERIGRPVLDKPPKE